MRATLKNYIPHAALTSVMQLIEDYQVHLKIVNDRQSKHGDFRTLTNGKHFITVNHSLNKYRFLITLIHEIAHLIAFKTYGRQIKPHGKEWKYVFQKLMLPLINPKIFPDEILPLLAIHFKNPRASSDTDAKLSIALKNYDQTSAGNRFTQNASTKNYIFELPLGSIFQTSNGRLFKKGHRLRKRYQCEELKTKRQYVFQPNAEVELIKS
ncbi:SprT-like domain-containing protein [Psychroflexus sp. ALD_RP9]|uniref:SprT-like domain-containing protein n=1 Tax=Psychroflexus sp. ALD_RP9 TaxID=2777186 RepID=UPI001A8D07C9|nr:SprT-like domain-containing protein [Psychroflexus sp. ALD_RP9]QSS96366.1 SprT-like domain-containing protein [Psychroflexus sp. ALD_RP9]